MGTIILGHFREQSPAENTSRELLRTGFSSGEMCLFYINPQGQHNIHPLGGDEDESPGTHEASGGAIRGALQGGGGGALLGAAMLPVLGPIAPLLGAAVGAYGGSLVGALSNMEDNPTEDTPDTGPDSTPPGQPHKAGVVLAVAVSTPEQRQKAIAILRGHTADAEDVEEANGTLRDGDWIDFDPLAPRKAVQ